MGPGGQQALGRFLGLRSKETNRPRKPIVTDRSLAPTGEGVGHWEQAGCGVPLWFLGYGGPTSPGGWSVYMKPVKCTFVHTCFGMRNTCSCLPLVSWFFPLDCVVFTNEEKVAGVEGIDTPGEQKVETL